MSLQDEIAIKSSLIFRESYQMSIGELINLYKESEMDIHPEFQRLFRWSDYQKTKLIESIMLNIPIPPIFVSQNEDGIWDIIDGVQRLSTIFQFVGILKDDEGEKLPSLSLQKTDYLPSFEGMKWEIGVTDSCFTKEQQLYFKRARFDVTIMKKESDPNTKYELFQRLNTGGTLLSDQEVRNCLMIMSNKEFYQFIVNLENDENFQRTVPISDRKSDEQYRLELVLRLVVAIFADWEKINQYTDFAQLLDKETVKLCEKDSFPFVEIENNFKNTFRILAENFSEDVFKKFNGEKHSGAFLSSAYQGIAFGVYSNYSKIIALDEHSNWLIEKVRNFYHSEKFLDNIIPGVRAIPRYRDLTLFGAEFFRA